MQRRPRFSGPDIDLRDLRVRRQELLVGKISPEHQQDVAGMHRGIAGREADEAGHADVVGIVELDMLLAAERMHDRALERLGKLHQAVMRAGTAAAAEQRDALGAVEEFGQRLQFAFGRPHDGRRRQQPGIGRDAALRRRPQRDVAGDDDDGDAAPPDGRANGVFQHVRQLRRIGNQFAIMAAFPEQVLRMRLLKIAAADLGRRNLRGDGEHRRAAAMRIEQAVDEMQIAGAARPRADGKLAGDLRFARRGEGRDLLMPDVDPVDRLSLAQRVGEAVEAVADHAEDALDAGLGQRLRDEVRDIVDLHVHDPFSASGEHRRTFLEEGVAPFHRVGAETDFRLRFDLAAELIGIAGVLALVDQTARRDQRARRAARRVCAPAQARRREAPHRRRRRAPVPTPWPARPSAAHWSSSVRARAAGRRGAATARSSRDRAPARCG